MKIANMNYNRQFYPAEFTSITSYFEDICSHLMKFEKFRSNCHSTNKNSNLNFPLQHSFLLHSNDEWIIELPFETEISIQLFNILNGKKSPWKHRLSIIIALLKWKISSSQQTIIIFKWGLYLMLSYLFGIFFIEPKLIK